jgi:DNA-binding LacI/PurR family transcriptional regulator
VNRAAFPGRPRPVTQEDVARAVGVSRTLVSFAFRGAPGVSAEMRQTILAAAKELGYRHNAAAADLASKQASAIGLFLLDLRNEVYADIFQGVREAVGDARNRLILSVSQSTGEIDRGSVDSLIEARVGIIIAATLLDSDARVRELAASVPIVNVTRRVSGVDSVYSDDWAGARAATQHLLGLGHTRIAHVTAMQYEGHEGRRRSYSAAMHNAGLAPEVVIADDYTQLAAERAAAVLLKGTDRPTAVFAHNDEMALGVREAGYAAGLSIPRDLSIVGYDNSRIAQLHGIDLTSVDMQARELGRSAGVAALNRLAAPDTPIVDRCTEPRLIIRNSTARRSR